MKKPESQRTYTLLEIASIFNVSTATIRRKMKEKGIFEELKSTRIYFEDKMRTIFTAFGSDYDLFIGKNTNLTNQ